MATLLESGVMARFIVAVGIAGSLAGCMDYPDAVAPHGNPFDYLKPDLGSLPLVDTSDGESSGGTTWHKDVRAIVEANCVRCHSSDGVGPMALDTFDAAQPYFDTMAAYVDSGRMPPWQFDDECREFAVTRGLSDDQKAVFAAWKAAGFPIGVASDYVAPEPPATFDPQGEVQVDMTRAAYSPTGAEARCFLLDQRVSVTGTMDTRGWWVTDLRVNPDKAALVQQATLYMLAPDEVAGVPSGAAGYACDFGAGTEGEVALVSWVPGAAPTSFPQETALLVPAGSRFVLRLRYARAGVDDATSVTLWHYLGRRTPTAERGQIGAFTATTGEHYLPHGQSLFAVIPEMSPGGESFLAEYLVGPIGTCQAESKAWDERFPETLPFAEGRLTNALMAQRTRVTCTHEAGASDPRCRATFFGRFPLYDGLAASIQPLGQPCSGVEGCLAQCSGQAYCLLNCIAWELPACGECARTQLFSDTCAAAVAGTTAYASFTPCLTSCPAEGDFSEWLGCLFASETCAAALNVYTSALTDGLVGGACNRPDEACLFMSPQSE